MISDEAVKTAARVWSGAPFPSNKSKVKARAALEAALPHLLASQGCGTGHSGEQLEPAVGATAALASPAPAVSQEEIEAIIDEQFEGGGGCVEGPDWDWNEREFAKVKKAAADAILSRIRQGKASTHD